MLACSLNLNKFNFQSDYYIHLSTNTLRKYMNPFIPQGIPLILLLQFSYQNGLYIGLPPTFDKPLNKEIKSNPTIYTYIHTYPYSYKKL